MNRSRLRALLLSSAIFGGFASASNLRAQQTSSKLDPIPEQDVNRVIMATEIGGQWTNQLTMSIPGPEAAANFIMASADPVSITDDLPDDPSTKTPPSVRKPQTKRILGIIPNFRSVSTDEKLPPQSPREKFITATQDSFDYSAVVIPLVLAGYSLAIDATPEFGQGMDGYGQYLWRAAVDQTTENYLVEFVVPVITRQDSRYYTLGRGGFFKRTGYALSRAVVTRSDSGKNVFNTSEIVGAGASAGISSTYYPASQRSFSNTASQWGLNIGVDAITFVLHEFWPDINHKFFHYEEPH